MSDQDYKNSVQELPLGHLWDLCYDAHRGTSFSPEKRATSTIIEFSELLKQDLSELGDKVGNYKLKFIRFFINWMNARTRCISTMIAGPSNFPVRQAEKANASERNHYEKFMAWRSKYFKAAFRTPTKSPEEELILAERHLEVQLNHQFRLKEINKHIRKLKTQDPEKIAQSLIASEFEFTKEELQLITDDYGRGYKIPGFRLTNLNARIRATKDKIVIMTNRIKRKESWEDIQFQGGYVTIEDDRLKIFHDQKPSREIINEIKTNGFRWSPYWKCWCRKHTGNAIYSLKRLSFIKGVS